jgi:cell division protein FtsI (penicillin-binding protein 3)
MMEGVVIKPYGTGHRYARLIGYTSAGKTGTAMIYDYQTRKYTHYYNASFMGFAPVTNPAIVVAVTINRTEGHSGYGAPTSAPVFREVAAAALRMKDVPKDLPEMLQANAGDSTKDDSSNEDDVAIAGLGSSVPPPLVHAESAVAANDRLVASAPDVLDRRTLLSSGGVDAAPDWAGPRAPNFQGKTVRDVIEESAELGVRVEFSGSGIARGQIPEPGAPLPLGQPVRIQFGR